MALVSRVACHLKERYEEDWESGLHGARIHDLPYGLKCSHPSEPLPNQVAVGRSEVALESAWLGWAPSYEGNIYNVG